MKKIVILASGSGSNLQRIIECIDEGSISNAKIDLVVADRECYALERADNHQIKNILIPRGKNFSSELDAVLTEDVDLIVLAGFLSILKPEFCKKWEGKIVNIHPSLLPKFGGKGMWGHYVHNAVVNSKEKESGATVHFVTSGIDEGEIILQGKTNVDESDTADDVAAKVHLVEYDIFPKAIQKVLNP